MSVARAGDEYRIHVRIVDRRVWIRLDARPDLSSHLGRFVVEKVVDHRYSGSPDPLAQRVNVKRAHHADAENGDPQLIAHFCLRNSMFALLQELRYAFVRFAIGSCRSGEPGYRSCSIMPSMSRPKADTDSSNGGISGTPNGGSIMAPIRTASGNDRSLSSTCATICGLTCLRCKYPIRSGYFL